MGNSDLGELEKWLLETTGAESVEIAREIIKQAMEIRLLLPNIGVVSIMVGPGGMYNLVMSSNLNTPEMIDEVETALLDAQRWAKQNRKQLAAAKQPG